MAWGEVGLDGIKREAIKAKPHNPFKTGKKTIHSWRCNKLDEVAPLATDPSCANSRSLKVPQL